MAAPASLPVAGLTSILLEEAKETLPPSRRKPAPALSSCTECLSFSLPLAAHSQPFGYHESPSSGGGPRQHSRPDGSRRRTAGELAKRAAKAAARAAAAAAGAAGGGAAKPAGPVVADAGASGPTQVPVSTAPTGELSASASASASASSATTSGPAHGACPDRMRHPPPSIAAGPKPSGDGQRAWMPTLKMKAPPPNLLQTGSAEAAPNAPPPAPPLRGRQKQLP